MTGTDYLDGLVQAKEQKKCIDHFNWIQEFTVTKTEAESFAAPDWIVQGLIVQGHLHIIAAEPNGGKTTIFFHLAGEMARDGFKVIYVNADISAGDAKQMVDQAKEAKFELLLPEMKAGKTMDDVVKNLIKLNDVGVDLTGYVFIFDTLKKMTDVINKSQSKRLLQLLRSLTAKGPDLPPELEPSIRRVSRLHF